MTKYIEKNTEMKNKRMRENDKCRKWIALKSYTSNKNDQCDRMNKK